MLLAHHLLNKQITDLTVHCPSKLQYMHAKESSNISDQIGQANESIETQTSI